MLLRVAVPAAAPSSFHPSSGAATDRQRPSSPFAPPTGGSASARAESPIAQLSSRTGTPRKQIDARAKYDTGSPAWYGI